jgi:hypothetical protein
VRFIYAGNLRVHGALDLVQLFRVSRYLQVIPPSYSLHTAFIECVSRTSLARKGRYLECAGG